MRTPPSTSPLPPFPSLIQFHFGGGRYGGEEEMRKDVWGWGVGGEEGRV